MAAGSFCFACGGVDASLLAEGEAVKQLQFNQQQTVNTGTVPTAFTVVDIEGLRLDAPEAACKTFQLTSKPRLVACDLLIVGGGIGGIAAAQAALANGVTNICLIEETSWLGGQMTAQAVSALDENALIESTGGTRAYKGLRESIRQHYRHLGATDGGARFEPWLDPGNCWVSRIAFEPAVAVAKIDERLQPAIEAGKLRSFMRYKAVSVKCQRSRIRSVLCVNLDTGDFVEFRCRFCLDATELGDLLPLAGVPYASGAESKLDTGELHAPLDAQPENVQDFTYPFVVEFCIGERHVIEKPPMFDQFNEQGKFSFNGYRMFENAPAAGGELLPFWEYRRLISWRNFPQGTFAADLSMINWDSNDLRGENIIDKPPMVVAHRVLLGKYLSLGFLYWLQTEAPRDDGGIGYPELKLRHDLVGTADGLSKYPYIRESRRLKSKVRLLESDIVASSNTDVRARGFSDSLGIGHYPVDIHAHQDVPGVAQATRPFQIPAAVLVQHYVRNFLPAGKNIGTTHITNGAYRLHPIEWAIGESAGTLAAECLRSKCDPWRLLLNRRRLRAVQRQLVENGAPLVWFDDVPVDHIEFAAIQFVSLSRLMPVAPHTLAFGPDEPMLLQDTAVVLARLLRFDVGPPKEEAGRPARYGARHLRHCQLQGLLGPDRQPEQLLSPLDLVALSGHSRINVRASVPATDFVSRAQFAKWLYEIVCTAAFFGRH